MLAQRAFTNVMRQLSRTLLSLWVMIIAAMVLTSSLSFSQGTASKADITYRNYYGGDILVFSPGFVGAAPLAASEESIGTRILRDSGFNLLAKLYPDFVTDGYLALEGWQYAPLSQSLLDGFAAHPNVAAAEAYRTLPAQLYNSAIDLRPFPWHDDRYELEGRTPGGGVDTIEIVVNAYRAPLVKVGDVMDINLPAVGLERNGLPYIDATGSSQAVRATVVGIIKRPTRMIGGTSGSQSSMEQGYVHAPDVYVDDETWAKLWAATSNNAPYPALNATLNMKDLSQVNVALAELRSQYPHLAFMSAQEIARHVERYSLLDWFYTVNPHVWMSYEEGPVQQVAPREFGLLSVMLLYLNAGLLLATQMMARMAERRKEMGILKAIGARQREVVGMIVLECIILALIGAFIGFVAIRSLAIHQAITNAVAASTIVLQTLKEFVQVTAITTAVALLFATVPALRVARLTVMEVFRND